MAEKQESCAICGKKLTFLNTQMKKYNGQKICTSCAWKITKNEMKENYNKAKEEYKEQDQKKGKCPKCGSENLEAYSDSKKQGYGASKGCCGYILMGPFGLLCGLCGNKDQTSSGRMCMDCGHKF